MVARASSCLRRLGAGARRREVQFWRFLANRKVTLDRLIEGWSERTAEAVSGRHILAIQDTSEINFKTQAGRRRGLGKVGQGGNGRGLLVHAMAAVDAESGSLLGLVAGKIWTRRGLVRKPHAQRDIHHKESGRWLTTAEAAKQVLAKAAMVTVIADRESDIYGEWASVPETNFHLLTRIRHDRKMSGGGKLSDALEAMPQAGSRTIELPARAPNAPARKAVLTLRYGVVSLKRPPNAADAKNMPESVTLTLIEALERHPPRGQQGVHWRLLTTHSVRTEAQAWQLVDWYRRRWVIEQLFRLMKSQGLDIEASQITEASRLLKLAAIVAHAAAVTLQLVQARDGQSDEPASVAFTKSEIQALSAIESSYNSRTKLQSNPHEQKTLAWAVWIIARLGGWDGYPSSRPPGPITIRRGLEYFKAYATGYGQKNVCML
jgi:hypothetical protein